MSKKRAGSSVAPHDPDRISHLRERVAKERTILATLESQVKDPTTKERVKKALARLDDIEGPLLLGKLCGPSMLIGQEEALLDCAETVFLAAELYRRAIQSAVT